MSGGVEVELESLGSAATPVSVVELLGTGVLRWRYKQGAVVDLEMAQLESRIIRELIGQHFEAGISLLIDIRGVERISREARKFFASKEVHDAFGIRALALLLGSPVSTLIGNFYQSVNRPIHPTRLFTTEAAAQLWLAKN